MLLVCSKKRTQNRFETRNKSTEIKKLLFNRASCTRSVQVIRSTGDPGRIVPYIGGFSTVTKIFTRL